MPSSFVIDTTKSRRRVVARPYDDEEEKVTYYPISLNINGGILQFFILSSKGTDWFRLYRSMRQNLTEYLQHQHDVHACPLFRCYAFMYCVLTGKSAFCADPTTCRHKLGDAEELGTLTKEHLAKNFSREEVTKFEVGDAVCFGRSVSKGEKEYVLEHFGIDFGLNYSGDYSKRLCLSKLGGYDQLFLTTHDELHRLYETDGRRWKLVLKDRPMIN